MTSPDYRTFVDTLIPGHEAWLAAHPAPSGNEFLDHYVGDVAHSDGLLWMYEAWRAEHGYTRIRPWNGTEALGWTGPAEIPSPGRVLPWLTPTAPPAPEPAGPSLADSFLADGTSTASLQTHFGVGNTNALGGAILTHWNSVRTFGGDIEINVEGTAPYSIRFWGFMKWASTLRNRLLGIPVFPIPIVWDADGVPLSDIEYMDTANRWHTIWHGGAPPCGQVTSDATNNPFAPGQSPFGQFCSRFGLAGEFLKFHRDLLDTYDQWRRRAGMPPVHRWRPSGLHFHEDTINGHAVPETDLSDDPGTEYQQIKDRVQHYNTLQDLADFEEGELHGAGHGAPESDDIADINTNNYSPRFWGWHRWMDYLWEVRQPRLDSLRSVDSTGADLPGALTVVRPAAPNPDLVQPNNALTGATPDGRGSLWIRYRVRPETWGRPIDLTVTAQVFRNSPDLAPVAGLDATTISLNGVAQGADSAATEIQFLGLDADGEGAFAHQAFPGGGTGFKNGRIRITARLVPVGNIPTSFAAGNDQFDYEQHLDVILVKEPTAPQVSLLLNKSSFSVDEIVVNADGNPQSLFANAFLVVVQDPTEPPPALAASAIFADPARTTVSGIFADPSVHPTVNVVDEMGNPVGTMFTVALTDIFKEQPTLADNVSQRVMFRYLAIADVAAVSVLVPNPGDIRYVRLRIAARDRSGNTVSNVMSPDIKLFCDANPYMIDVQGQNPGWLSIDTRVFSVRNSELRFGHRVSTSGSAPQYIQDVIAEFNSGTQDFDSIPADEGQAQLELAPQVAGENVYDFALARVRMRTQSAVPDVRTFFRLFTTAVSNLSFTNVNYPTSGGPAPIALLGRTAPDLEITSIPFFAVPRVETRDSMAGAAAMSAQTDPPNVQTFAVTPPGGETIRYFGAYLDINSDTPRYPAAPVGDGPFPTAQCVSIRNIIRGQHQCMVAEVFYPGDPTEPNSTPGTSDNLAQRNLLIVETANPGVEATHTAQHSFDIVLASRRERDRVQVQEEIRRRFVASFALRESADHAARFAMDERSRATALAARAPSADPIVAGALAGAAPWAWRDVGFDELVFFWNNLPLNSRVEVFLPSMDVEYVLLVRRLRNAPNTVRTIDEHTLSLQVGGATYLPIPNVGIDRVAGLLTVTLPDGIKAGQVYTVDVVQTRAALGMVVGAFRLTIPVGKAPALYAREERILAVFQERLKLTPHESRWYPILRKQVDYLAARAKGLAQEAADECTPDGDKRKGLRARVIVERVRILDVFGPLVHGSGRLALVARVTSAAGRSGATMRLPTSGEYPVQDLPGGYVVEVDREVFRGVVADDLTVEIWSAEPEEHERTCHYRRTFKGKAPSWIGGYGPSDESPDPENVGDWQLWYRIEEI